MFSSLKTLKNHMVEFVSEKNQSHNVRLDFVGFNEDRPRLTCFTDGCEGKTILRQPYMNNEQWKKVRDEFLASHPCLEIGFVE